MTLFAICLSLISFTSTANNGDDDEYFKLLRLEQRALRNGVGKAYIYDLTGRKECNKTRIKYLGIVRTKQGKQYKILSSFFVFSTASSCRGTSRIKLFDMQNKFIGEYNMGMPDALPDALRNNKLVFSKSQDNCIPRKKLSINFGNGIPKTLTIPCSKSDGEIGYFSSNY